MIKWKTWSLCLSLVSMLHTGQTIIYPYENIRSQMMSISIIISFLPKIILVMHLLWHCSYNKTLPTMSLYWKILAIMFLDKSMFLKLARISWTVFLVSMKNLSETYINILTLRWVHSSEYIEMLRRQISYSSMLNPLERDVYLCPLSG